MVSRYFFYLTLFRSVDYLSFQRSVAYVTAKIYIYIQMKKKILQSF